jgi:hypothetical protein
MKEFNVAVFVHKHENPKRHKFPYKVLAYLRDYNPEWSGYNKVSVYAKNGSAAKNIAIKIIKARLAIDLSNINISAL